MYDAARVLTAWLQRDGYAADGDVPLMEVTGKGRRFLFAVEAKRGPIEYRETGELKHGLDFARVEKWRNTAEAAGLDIFLAIYESETGDLLVGSLFRDLNKDAGEEQKRGGRDGQAYMTYWPRSAFPVVCSTREDGEV